MALFTKFKKAKEAAVEHKKTAAAQDAKPPTAPYKHYPTHAKEDALASQPTTLKPAELQARIAAARKRRASSYQAPLAARHSIYHSCESSRASSRTSSTAALSLGSTTPRLKGNGKNDASIDAVMQRSRSLSSRHSPPMASGQPQPGELLPISGGSLALPPPVNQRPRPYQTMSSRSSFAKKKSPLSNVSVDEEPDKVFSNSSNTSAVSYQSSKSDDLQPANKNGRESMNFSKPGYTNNGPRPVVEQPVRRRSKWQIFPPKSMDIAAH